MMSDHRSPETEYARRLRAELTTIVAERGAERAAHASRDAPTAKPAWRRRGPRLGFAGAAVAAIAIVALVVGASGGDTPAAFAVEAQADGYVSVEINSLEEAKGLEEALGDAGIPASVTYLQSGMACKEPRFQPVPWSKAARVIVTGSGNSGPIVFHVGSEAVGSGLTLVITASSSTYATFDTFQVKFAEGTVAPCDPAPAMMATVNPSGPPGARLRPEDQGVQLPADFPRDRRAAREPTAVVEVNPRPADLDL